MRFLILDLDTKFTAQFKRILHDAGVEVVHTAYQAPNMNVIAERWVLSVKRSASNRMTLFGERSLRRSLCEYGAHFNQQRPHQGLGNELVVSEPSDHSPAGEIVETERLGGLLRSYNRAA